MRYFPFLQINYFRIHQNNCFIIKTLNIKPFLVCNTSKTAAPKGETVSAVLLAGVRLSWFNVSVKSALDCPLLGSASVNKTPPQSRPAPPPQPDNECEARVTSLPLLSRI